MQSTCVPRVGADRSFVGVPVQGLVIVIGMKPLVADRVHSQSLHDRVASD